MNYLEVFKEEDMLNSIKNSILLSSIASVISIVSAFTIAYAINMTNIKKNIKSLIEVLIVVPMFFPTITYGFAIMYSFGKEGLLTKIFNRELIYIYGYKGVILGFVIYTLPISFLIINNSFKYIDKKYLVVSELMGDNQFQTFKNTILRPILPTVVSVFIMTFILSFTDFGIPASIGGKVDLMSTKLYKAMLGSIPNINKGAVLSVIMLIPAVVSIFILKKLEKYNYRFDKITKGEPKENIKRDVFLGGFSLITIFIMLSIFLVIFLVPIFKDFPYDLTLDFKTFKEKLFSNDTTQSYMNSLFVAIITMIAGTIISYLTALLKTRRPNLSGYKKGLDVTSIIINSIPGMVLGISYLLVFKDSSLKGTFAIIIISNIVHFFTTPYTMAKNSLEKLSLSWETTGELMGDSWIKTVFRIVIPNSKATIIEMALYYFTNSMVTISAVIFLVTARTTLLTSKIKELQHFANFKEIFIISMLIFVTNISAKILAIRLKNKVQ